VISQNNSQPAKPSGTPIHALWSVCFHTSKLELLGKTTLKPGLFRHTFMATTWRR